ncbi:hypothetical protein C2S52_019965 [Perilla frutescens var. hirtella]|nr:hypothetical protein C2S52_019965 [Perilla frutescens var. hirtella]KAH6805811.1 hypothetical protein C2S51_030642 [Perilla frutescens var. frutescens]
MQPLLPVLLYQKMTFPNFMNNRPLLIHPVKITTQIPLHISISTIQEKGEKTQGSERGQQQRSEPSADFEISAFNAMVGLISGMPPPTSQPQQQAHRALIASKASSPQIMGEKIRGVLPP